MTKPILLYLLVTQSFTHSFAHAQEPQIKLVQSGTTQKHVSIHPKTDYHQVYLPIKVLNASGKTAYVQVRSCVLGDQAKDSEIATQALRFNIGQDEELWQIYLRAPRYSQDALYQLEYGFINHEKIDPLQSTGSFPWLVLRSMGEVKFTKKYKDSNGVEQIPGIPIVVRVPIIEGGKIRIVLETKSGAYGEEVQFGEDRSEISGNTIDGSGAKRIK